MTRIRAKSGAMALLALAACCLVVQPAAAQTPKLTLIAASSFAAPELPFEASAMGPSAGVAELVATPAVLPRMAPELALATFEHRAQQQMAGIPSYSATTVIAVDLPDTQQHGIFELRRGFSAPRSLRFTPVHYSGDSFVKSSVITRLLQQEVSQTEKGEGAKAALDQRNYKFTFKGEGSLAGHAVYVYQVKPRAKLVGLFKGRIYLDSRSGALCRAEGELVKSPSFFIKKIKFTSDFADVQGYSLPVHIHSDAATRIIGRAQVDISNTDYAFADPGALLASR